MGAFTESIFGIVRLEEPPADTCRPPFGEQRIGVVDIEVDGARLRVGSRSGTTRKWRFKPSRSA